MTFSPRPYEISTSKEELVAANRQQGSYLVFFLAGFTALVAGLAAWSSSAGLGVVLTLAGLAMLAYSVAGFIRIKRLEFTE
jgi:hypothetical protein